jgi:TonB-linked SusC/RagA family outer membrane protein
MRKLFSSGMFLLKNKQHRHIFRVMRLTTYLLLFVVSLAFAEGTHSQNVRISLNRQGAILREVLEDIERQTDYLFISNISINLEQTVSIRTKNKPVWEVLNLLFEKTDLSYAIEGVNIILTRKPIPTPGIPIVQQQKKTVTGIITDTSGEPIIGVNILEKGIANGTVTDLDGKFSLEVSLGATLVISYIGYNKQEVAVGNQTDLRITLMEDTQALEEVVVVGYGSQKKINLTGAVDVIDNKLIMERQSPTVSQLLQGLAPGFNFTVNNQDGFQPGANMDITIRGMGSLNGGSPYIVIDGFPGDINNLNPEDIESVSVLKDAAASAIYGARAPYGVVLVTTKKGKKSEKMKITYSGNMMVNTPQKLPASLDSYTWSRIQNEAGDNMGGHPVSDATIDRIIAYQKGDWDYLRQSMPNWPEGATIFGSFPEGNVWNSANLNYANNDWWDIYFGHSVNQKHDVSIQGGTEKASYYFSAGYLDQNSVLNFGKDEFQRINIMGKVNIALADWWDFSWESRMAKKYRERPNMTSEGDYSFMYRHISRAYPFTPLYDGWGNYTFESHIPSIESGTDRYDDWDYWNNFKVEIRPLTGWKINADFAYNTTNGTRLDVEKYIMIHNVDNSVSPNGVSVPNNIERLQYNNYYWTSNIYTTYTLDINEIHNFSIMAGMQYEKGNNTQLIGYKTDMIVENVPSLQTATGSSILTESLSHRATQGYFSRLNYNYKEKYLFEANVRYDGSYVFRKDNRWGFFPSLALGWNLHKETFWENVEPYVNTLKIRGSWGQLGNQNVNPYTDLELIPLQTGKLGWIFNYGDNRPVGYTSAPGIVNRNLTWETATTKNIGIETSFLQNRLQANLDLFERLTTNMVGPSEAKPGVLGANVPNANNSSLRTRGWELTLNWKQNINKDFSYFVNFNLYDYKSVVTQYHNPTGSLSTWYEGKEVGEIWGYKVNDLFRSQSELDDYRSKVDMSFLGTNWRTGDLRYEDTNGDGKVNNGTNTVDNHGDISIIGNDQPHYQYGFSLGVNYKGFDFSMLWKGVLKKDIYFYRMANIFWGFTNGWWESTLTPNHLDYYRDAPGTQYSGLYEGDANINTSAYWPRPYLNGTEEAKNKNNPNTRYLQDASYLRIQNIQLGYTLPKNWTSKLFLENVRIYFSGENLFTFSKLPDGLDPVAPVGFPEGGAGNYYGTEGSGRLTYGADRIYSFGITVTY